MQGNIFIDWKWLAKAEVNFRILSWSGSKRPDRFTALPSIAKIVLAGRVLNKYRLKFTRHNGNCIESPKSSGSKRIFSLKFQVRGKRQWIISLQAKSQNRSGRTRWKRIDADQCQEFPLMLFGNSVQLKDVHFSQPGK